MRELTLMVLYEVIGTSPVYVRSVGELLEETLKVVYGLFEPDIHCCSSAMSRVDHESGWAGTPVHSGAYIGCASGCPRQSVICSPQQPQSWWIKDVGIKSCVDQTLFLHLFRPSAKHV